MKLAPFRVCSTLILRAVDDESRTLEGVASSSQPDLAGDVLETKGASYSLPMPLLMQHDKNRPIGEVIAATMSASEIAIRATIARDTGLAYVEDAWRQLKAGLVKGLSIGAAPQAAEPILDKNGRMTGVRYTAWKWLELSAVTLPMNTAATIEVVRSFDPWGAAAFAVRHELRGEPDGPEPADHSYEATRARAVAALNAAARALHRGP